MNGNDRKNYIIVSACNDNYMPYLLDLLDSLVDVLVDYDLGIIDLGLSDEAKREIRERKPGAIITDPGWMVAFRGHDKRPEHQKIFVAKPFIPEIFPGYRGYLWVDADVWFQDPGAVADYIDAGQSTGAAVCYEMHPAFAWFQKVRKTRIPPFIWLKGIRDYHFDRYRLLFGTKAAIRRGTKPIINGGIFYLAADSPGWPAWQRATKRARLNNPKLKGYLSDDTCMECGFIEEAVPHTSMPAKYDWPAGLGAALLDLESGMLCDPLYPYDPLKVVHLVHLKDELGNVRTHSGETIRVPLKRSAFLAYLADQRRTPATAAGYRARG